jgi:hypothetical protein
VAYYDVTVVVEGAVDCDEMIVSDNRDEWALQRFLKGVEVAAQKDGKQTDVFVQFHDHSNEFSECSCAQYEQSGKPTHTFP